MKFIDLATQYQQAKTRIDQRIQSVLDHGQYIMGPEVKDLEKKLSEYVGVKHAITCANGTDALTLALMALEIGEGDAVFVPTFTFFASAESIAFAKATPVFIDSDPDTFNICPKDLERKIKSVQNEGKLQLKAIMTVDLFGLPANYVVIRELADRYSLKIIEDSAQGFGGSIDGKKSGSFGDIATTSFFPAKPLGCYGDGGAVFTDNDEYAFLIESYRVHGKGKDKYDNVRIGINSRLDTIQAAILLEKLELFDEEMGLKNNIANLYNDSLQEKVKIPCVPKGYVSSWAQYTIILNNENTRNKIHEALKVRGIPTHIYYRNCLHQQPVFTEIAKQYDKCDIAEKHSKTVLSLPMHAYLYENEVRFITETIREIVV